MPKVNEKALDMIEQRHHRNRKMLLATVKSSLLSWRYVGGEGDNPQAFIIGEAPGAHEDMALRPFVGPAGQVLRQLMAIAGLSTTDFYDDGRDNPPTAPGNCWLTNVVKFRPRGNHTPSWFEIAPFRDLLRQEWKAVGSPSIIIPVGSVALTAIYGYKHGMSIMKIAGTRIQLLSKEEQQLRLCPMIHPSYGIRNPEIRPTMEKHWTQLGEWLDEHHR